MVDPVKFNWYSILYMACGVYTHTIQLGHNNIICILLQPIYYHCIYIIYSTGIYCIWYCETYASYACSEAHLLANPIVTVVGTPQ